MFGKLTDVVIVVWDEGKAQELGSMQLSRMNQSGLQPAELKTPRGRDDLKGHESHE